MSLRFACFGYFGLCGHPAACRGLLRRAVAGCLVAMAGQRAAMRGYGYGSPSGRLSMAAYAIGPSSDSVRLLTRSVALRLPSSQVDSPCLARRDALDGLTVVVALAHELFSTCDCLEDPRRRAADSRRQRPFIRAGT